MPTLVDSSVILDVVTDDARWASWSAAALERAADEDVLVINPLIYAEVSVGFERIEDVEAALPELAFRREALPYEAAFLAGKAFLAYRRRSGRKTSPLPDFYIAAHAAVRNHRLLTRDARRIATSFPSLAITSP